VPQKRWSIWTGGYYYEVVVKSGLTVCVEIFAYSFRVLNGGLREREFYLGLIANQTPGVHFISVLRANFFCTSGISAAFFLVTCT